MKVALPSVDPSSTDSRSDDRTHKTTATADARTTPAAARLPKSQPGRRFGGGAATPHASPEATSERSSSSSMASSRAVWNRRSGSLTRQRWMILASCRGSEPFTSVTEVGLSRRMADITETALSPRNGLSPVAIS